MFALESRYLSKSSFPFVLLLCSEVTVRNPSGLSGVKVLKVRAFILDHSRRNSVG